MSTGCGKQGSTVITVSHKGKRYETEQFSLVSPTSSFVQPLFTHQSHDLSRTSKSCLLVTFNFKVVTIKELGHLLLHHLPLSPPPQKKMHIYGRIFHVALHHIFNKLDNTIATLSFIFSEMFFFPFFFFFFFLFFFFPIYNFFLYFCPKICSLAMVAKMFTGCSTVQCQFSIMCAKFS